MALDIEIVNGTVETEITNGLNVDPSNKMSDDENKEDFNKYEMQKTNELANFNKISYGNGVLLTSQKNSGESSAVAAIDVIQSSVISKLSGHKKDLVEFQQTLRVFRKIIEMLRNFYGDKEIFSDK